MGKDMSPGSGSSVTAQAKTAEELEGYEVIDVNVSNDGFEPGVIEVKAGVPTKINFILTRSVTHVKSVGSQALGMDLYMQKETTTTPLMKICSLENMKFTAACT